MLRLPEILTYFSHFSSPGNTWLLGKFPEDCAFEWRASSPRALLFLWPLLDGQLSPLGHWAWTLPLLYLLPKWLQWTACWFVFGILKARWYLLCYLSPILAPISCCHSEFHLYLESGQCERICLSGWLWGPFDFLWSISWQIYCQLKSAYIARV